ncbi:MAG: 2'-5' RNA ligase family protein [Actinomycetales bacterium]
MTALVRPSPTDSAVLTLMPAVDPVVREYRRRYDRAATWGVPAHVTILYPFVPPDQIDSLVLGRLAHAAREVAAFDVTFASMSWFGEDVLWLAPAPAAPFQQLTAAVCAQFPGYLPYDGAHDEVVPHLTVGESRFGSVAALRAAASELDAHLPVSQRVTELAVLTGADAPESWQVTARLPLG